MRETAKSHFSLMKRCAVTAWCVFVFACAAVLAGLPLQAFASEEVEPNNTDENATPINIGEAVNATLGSEGTSSDTDVYQFEITGSASVTLSIAFPSHTQGDYASRVKLFDNNDISYEWTVGTGVGDGTTYTWTSSEFNLPAGRYL